MAAADKLWAWVAIEKPARLRYAGLVTVLDCDGSSLACHAQLLHACTQLGLLHKQSHQAVSYHLYLAVSVHCMGTLYT